ncbi:MAG: aspartate aminotransferase family protein [Bacillota bacterium]|nr:aspartate aminotransferase family protein [Bacillota bacterium]
MNSKPSLDAVRDLDARCHLNTFGKRLPILAVAGDGCYLIDENGRRYLDLIGGIAVNVLGHGNIALAAALTDQVSHLIHCSNLVYNPWQSELARRLCQATGMDRVFFGNSGAEANEGAIKLARGYHVEQGRPRARVLSATDSFHGRTLATVTATGQPKYNQKFAPLPPGFSYLPFGDEAALTQAMDDDVACLILELIQGESGIHPLSRDYVALARRLCDQTGALLIIDEIQTGMGRTGHFTACQLYNVKPDIMTLAKGLGGGVPIGALLATEQAATGFVPGDHGSTFGGNPLACRAALTVLSEYERLGLVARAQEAGKRFCEALQPTVSTAGPLVEIRGAGLMLGLELASPTTAGGAAAVRDRLLAEDGILINSIGQTTLRLLPPLTISDAEIDLAARAIVGALQK